MERENPFKKIGIPNKEVPKELKEKVMSEIASLKLVTDIASLFTSNYQATMASFFKVKKKS
ncbi:hypothetical protein [Aquimarina muelleri]|uniref:Uncharacterized protein n=1 Tax=Aquimarina muelleri TaxID=279356 RepID=A0A918N4N7_9FLAO|nr:hypothetical protein [Aquimarina muelleri]MCX2763676.1 hypothetical protein [Aquimarina muelleri]GGX30261.1 hypothetical protein GCM10007384_34210 [Aquimarina muelleri]